MFDANLSANPVPVGTNGRGAISQRRAVSRPPLVPMPCHLRDEPCCTTVALARHFMAAAQRQRTLAATRGLAACDDARPDRWRPCCTSHAARTFGRVAVWSSASARNGAGRRGRTRPMWPGPAPASVANVRNEAARHRVHDAQSTLGAARWLAARRGPRRPDCRVRLADDPATRLPQARPDDVAGRSAHLAPAGEEKNGRRPHRCLQSEREVALRRP